MYSCHQCSYVLDDSSAPLPSRCPRCGATVERKLRPAGDSATGGAPRIPTLPPFPRLELKPKSAQQPRAQTIFGLEAILPPPGDAPSRAKTPSPVPTADDPPDEELTDYEGFTPLDDAADGPPLELGFTPAGSGTTSDSALITGIPDFAGRDRGTSADRSDDYLTLDALGPGLGESSNAGPAPQRPMHDPGSAELPGLPSHPAEESHAELPVIPQAISLDDSALLPGLTPTKSPGTNDAELPGIPDTLSLDESAQLPGLRGIDPGQSNAELPALSDPLDIGESAPLPGLRNDGLPDLTDALAGDVDDLDLNLPAPGGNLPTPGGNLPTPGASLPTPGGSYLPAPGGSLPRPGGQLPTPGVSLPRSASSLPQSAASLPTPGGTLPRSGAELPRSGTELPRSPTGTLHGRGPRSGAPPPPPRTPGRPPPPPGANRNVAASGAALADELPSLDELGDLDGDHLPPLSDSGLEDSLPSLDDLGPEPANSGPSVPLRSAGKSSRANPPPMGASTQIDSVLKFAKGDSEDDGVRMDDEGVPSIGDLDLDLGPVPSAGGSRTDLGIGLELDSPLDLDHDAHVPSADMGPALELDESAIPKKDKAPEQERAATAAPAQAATASPSAAPKPYRANIGASPTPKQIPRERPSPLILASIGGATLLVLGAAGAWFGGVFDTGTETNPVAVQNPTPKDTSNKIAGLEQKIASAAERSAGFLDALALDTPKDYARAIELATQSDDLLGVQEAKLLSALREQLSSAAPLPKDIENIIATASAFAPNEAHHVQRVVALAELASGTPAKAEERLAAALKTEAGAQDPLVYVYRSLVAHAQHRDDLAQQYATDALQWRADLKSAALLRNVFALSMQEPPKTQAGETLGHPGLQALATANDATFYPRYAYASSLFREAQWIKSLEIANAALQSASSLSESTAWSKLIAEIYMGRGDYSPAATALQSAIEKDPNDADLRHLYFESLLRGGDHAKARSAIDEAIASGFVTPDALILRAHADSALGEGALALFTIRRVESHLVANSPLELPKDQNAASAEKALAEQIPPSQLMTMTEGLDKVAPLKHDIAARTALARAEVLSMRMALDAATVAYETARQLDPLLIDATSSHAALLAKAGKSREAFELLNASAKSASELVAYRAHHARSEWIRKKAQLLSTAGELRQAERQLRSAHRIEPGNPFVTRDLAVAMQQTGSSTEAETLLMDLQDQTGGLPELLTPLAQVYLQRGEIEKLDALIGSDLDVETAPIELILNQSQLRLAQDRIDDADRLIDGALIRNPNNWYAHMVKAQILLRRGEAETALTQISRARPRDPDATYELWQGKIAEANGNLDEAYAHYREAIKLNPNFVEAKIRQSKILAIRGAAKEAIKTLKPLLRRDVEHPDAYLALGIAHRDLRKIDNAVQFFQAAQRLSPNSYEAFYEEGRVESDRNRHARAIRALERAVALSDQIPQMSIKLDALRRLGRAYKEAGNRGAARETLQRFLDLAPRSEPARAEVERMMRSL